MIIRWTDVSKKNLYEIRRYIARSHPATAKKFVKRLKDDVSIQLRDFPLSGRIIPEIEDPLYREIIFGNYRIMYKAEESLNTILAVRNSNQLFRPL